MNNDHHSDSGSEILHNDFEKVITIVVEKVTVKLILYLAQEREAKEKERSKCS